MTDRLLAYSIAFTHRPPFIVMARSLAHALSSAQELCPNSQFMSAFLVPEWDDASQQCNEM